MSNKALKSLADKLFSEIVRITGADENGYNQCYTCRQTHQWKDLQCGHFFSRRYSSIRWYKNNARPQCVGCNMFNQGRQYEFGKKLEKEIGIDQMELLIHKKNNRVSLDKLFYDTLIDSLRQTLAEINKPLRTRL